jgi:hypothetical protein
MPVITGGEQNAASVIVKLTAKLNNRLANNNLTVLINLPPLNQTGTSMISFVKGKTEISHNLPNSTDGLVFLLHAVQSF